MNKIEPLELIEQGLVPELRKGSATTQLLGLLLLNEGGLTHPQLIDLTGLNKKTLDAAILRLSQIEQALTKLGFQFKKEKLSGNRYKYRIERMHGIEVTLEGHTFLPVLPEMQASTQKQAEEGVAYERKLNTALPLDWEFDETLANFTIRNATWAYSVPQGEHFAVKHIMQQAVAGNAVRSGWLRNEWEARDGKPWDPNFFHELEKTSYRYAPELGFIIRCATELSSRGIVMGAFIESDLRKRLHYQAPPLKRAGLETCFDRIRAFNAKECRDRVKEVKSQPRAANFPFNLFEAVIKDQQRGVERSAVQLAKELGVKREIVQRWVMVSIENREDWRVYLRSRTGDRGLECASYEGPLPL